MVAPQKSYSQTPSVNTLRGRLYLLAKLPPRDAPAETEAVNWKRTRLSLRLDDTPANRKVAERRRQELQRQLDRGEFSWAFWGEEAGGMSWREAIGRLYRQKVLLGRTSENTWAINYMGRLKQIDPGSLCTTASIEKALVRYPRESCSYKEMFHLLKHIAKLASVSFPEVPLPTYGQAAAPEVPGDAEIVAVVERADPVVSWYLGMMAAFGLRPHEIDGAELLERGRLRVADGTKTGTRTVVACPPEWVERFDLANRRPRQYQPRGGDWRPDTVARWLWAHLRKLEVTWRPYALRHAYAGRLWRLGGSRLDLYTAARLMGHSPMQHARTYRSHVDPNTIADAAERALFGP